MTDYRTRVVDNISGQNMKWNGTAWVEDVAGASFQFPIGYLVFNETGTNPGTDFGYGTWAQIGQGQFLVGQNPADVDFDVAGEIGGAKTHTHDGHLDHTSAGTHTHDAHVQGRKGGTTNPQDIINSPVTHSSVGGHTHDTHSAHNTPSHIPPYRVVYWFKRTA